MKKTKFMTRLGAVVFALAILFAMAVPALADTDATNNVYTGSGNTLATSGITLVADGANAGKYLISLTKSVIFFNENASTVYEPNLVYEYSVAPQDPGNATVTDDGSNNPVGTPVTITVNRGVDNSVTFENLNANNKGTITFSPSTTAATAAKGAEVEKSVNLLVDPAAFNHAGIYRYKITEDTAEATKNAVGVVQGTSYDNTRYLDIYVSNGTNGYEVTAAVFFKTVETTSDNLGKDSIDANAQTAFEKTTGFEPSTPEPTTHGQDIDYTSEENADKYTTYDFSVKKEVAGGLADKSHQFPFYVSITNTISGAKYKYYAVNDSTGTDVTTTSATTTQGSNSINSALKLKHGDFVKFVGVPSNTDVNNPLSIDITEWNDTKDEYTASVGATSGTPAINGDGKMAKENGTASINTFDLKGSDIAGQIITLTNRISEISPTGLAFRVAPYVLMLTAAISMILLFAKRRRDVTDMI